ncbi:MAG TPA: rhomboid family intramembrane serine protease [Thermoanaerobaculia bacterium]|nr:rhomboid family intramembrane serine protease [Thermoanaerobaculia bacterium]
MNAFGLQSPQAWSEWWRLWTCHLVHWDWSHLLLNLVAILPPMALVSGRIRWRLLGWALVAAPFLSLAILASGFQGEYRGASGLVVGIWVLAGLTLVRESAKGPGLLLLSVIAGKLLLEALGAWPPASADYVTNDVVHYAGALMGALAAVS